MMLQEREGKPHEILPKPPLGFFNVFPSVTSLTVHSTLSCALTDVIDFSKTSMSIPLHFSKRGWRTVI